MNKTDVRVKRTYGLLMNALLELMKEKDFENLSVSDICEKAGVHRATFYKHFNDKIEFIRLLRTIKREGADIERLIKKLENAKYSFPSFLQKKSIGRGTCLTL